MDKFDPSAGYPVAGDLLRLLFLATTRTANKAIRKRFLKAIDAWLDQFESAAETKAAAKRCKRALNKFKGSSLEPLIFNPWDVEIAARLTRMAMHFGGMKTGSDEAILIGSRDAIGGGGGLYLHKTEEAAYLERFPYGKETPVTERTWSFSPQYEDDAVEEAQSTIFELPGVHVLWKDGGLLVPLGDNRSINWLYSDLSKLKDDLQRHSTVGDNGEGFGRFGLAVSIDKKDVLIQSERPESMLRLSAVMSQNGLLVLDPEGSPHGHRCALNIQLAEPDEDGTKFKATVHSRDSALSSWISLPILKSHPIIDQDILRTLVQEFNTTIIN
jgi:hypothetical protein